MTARPRNKARETVNAARRSLVLSAPLLILSGHLLRAQETPLPQPVGPVTLTIDGDISITNGGGTAVFDDAMLGDLPSVSFETSTVWTDSISTFSGPTLRSVLDRVGAGPGNITAMAINKYEASISQEYILDNAPIIANRLDGAPFGLRQKGPLWVIFPYDSDITFRTKKIYAMSIWQLEKLTVTTG
ncbi:oxidoreductase [Roseovarius sp. LXJ103]|uniref:oxidoreductase n=1 Tax=Roseovarius carneus TaxID=2853164 RepID=UPI000D614BF9|nr:oxidoreductase [Roseovarius carneus]MBZ8117740.1 oxidoreductase [Roseovarius carneus]PWE36487.1 oxidoreductase [Pelagicola sp. LXJ1103]